MNRTFRVELLRFDGARPIPETAALLTRHVGIEPAEARSLVAKTPALLSSELSVVEAQSLIAKLVPLGAHLRMVNEQTGQQSRYPESVLSSKRAAPSPKAPSPVEPPRTALPPSLRSIDGPNLAKGEARRRRKPSVMQRLTRTGEARAMRRRKFERANDPAVVARKRLRALSAIGAVLLVAVVVFWKLSMPESIDSNEVDGPYSFGPAGYDYVAR